MGAPELCRPCAHADYDERVRGRGFLLALLVERLHTLCRLSRSSPVHSRVNRFGWLLFLGSMLVASAQPLGALVDLTIARNRSAARTPCAMHEYTLWSFVIGQGVLRLAPAPLLYALYVLSRRRYARYPTASLDTKMLLNESRAVVRLVLGIFCLIGATFLINFVLGPLAARLLWPAPSVVARSTGWAMTAMTRHLAYLLSLVWMLRVTNGLGPKLVKRYPRLARVLDCCVTGRGSTVVHPITTTSTRVVKAPTRKAVHAPAGVALADVQSNPVAEAYFAELTVHWASTFRRKRAVYAVDTPPPEDPRRVVETTFAVLPSGSGTADEPTVREW